MALNTKLATESVDWRSNLDDMVQQVEAGSHGAANRLFEFDVDDGRRATVYLLVTTDIIDNTGEVGA